MIRPKSSARDLPNRLLRRTKTLKSGKVWVSFYYNGRDENGKRKEIPLGSDINEARRKWAEFEAKSAPVDTGLMRFIFDRYIRDIVPTKAPRTQKDNLAEVAQLRKVFDTAPINAITPQHIARYRDARTAKVRANREISTFSHVFNMAREWGYTANENPAKGVRKNKEQPRDYYADSAVWQSVYSHACQELQDAMDLGYLTGQRPADVISTMLTQIEGDVIRVKQGKTSKMLRIRLTRDDGTRTGLGALIDKIMARPRVVASLYLIATPKGERLNRWTLRARWDKARDEAVKEVINSGEPGCELLAERIKGFQFRDIRPKAASEMELEHASKLLGHSDRQLTEKVYRRIGELVNPTK